MTPKEEVRYCNCFVPSIWMKWTEENGKDGQYWTSWFPGNRCLTIFSSVHPSELVRNDGTVKVTLRLGRRGALVGSAWAAPRASTPEEKSKAGMAGTHDEYNKADGRQAMPWQKDEW